MTSFISSPRAREELIRAAPPSAFELLSFELLSFELLSFELLRWADERWYGAFRRMIRGSASGTV